MKSSNLIISLLTSLLLVKGLSNLDRPRDGFLQALLETSPNSCKPTGLIQDACCDFETAETVNSNLATALHELVSTPFFRFHKVDLFRECPFWSEDGSCANRACGVETLDEEHIPEDWRSLSLGAIKHSELNDTSQLPAGASRDDSNFCVLEDEADSEGLYVDLLANPERFTGYAGPSSSRVWKAIYEENCFTPIPFIDPSTESSTGFAPLSMGMISKNPNLGGGFGKLSGWGAGEKRLMGSLAAPRDGAEEICLEKRVFYRLISGLHASISIHICDDYLDQKTGLWAPNLECFITRIAQHPERLQNAYFSYVLMLRALSKSGPQLLATLAETSSKSLEDGTKKKLESLVKVASGCGETFDETSMFSGGSSEVLKTEFKQHFRNISRIMDCVGCDKCRLWGKLQITGMGTALKVLFSSVAGMEEEGGGMAEPLVLSRGEVVAFVNTLHRFSESLMAVDKFRKLWSDRSKKEEGEQEVKEKEEEKVVVVDVPEKKERQVEVKSEKKQELEAAVLAVESTSSFSSSTMAITTQEDAATSTSAAVIVESTRIIKPSSLIESIQIPIPPIIIETLKKPVETLTEAFAAMVKDYKSRQVVVAVGVKDEL